MFNMFKTATNFNQPLAWDTSKVAQMAATFRDAEAFDQFLLWDVSSVGSYNGFDGGTTFRKHRARKQRLPQDVHVREVLAAEQRLRLRIFQMGGGDVPVRPRAGRCSACSSSQTRREHRVSAPSTGDGIWDGMVREARCLNARGGSTRARGYERQTQYP